MNDAVFSQNIEQWYVNNKRDLPWRRKPTPYRVWLAEIVFQQTQIKQGMGHYNRLLAAYPSVKHLAEASEDDVLKHWEGLGYYTRARNLHKAAKIICKANAFPKSSQEWQSLPGVGPYTAAAIASVCASEPVACVDGNVMRVLARTHAIPNDVRTSSTQKQMRDIANNIIQNAEHPGNFNQGMMELGALICTPTKPLCDQCPVQHQCTRYTNQLDPALFPFKSKPKARQIRHLHFAFASKDTHILLKRNPSKGVWAGLYLLPFTEGKNNPIKPNGVLLKKSKHLLSHQEIHYYIWDIKTWNTFPYSDTEYVLLPLNKSLPAMPTPLKKFIDGLANL